MLVLVSFGLLQIDRSILIAEAQGLQNPWQWCQYYPINSRHDAI